GSTSPWGGSQGAGFGGTEGHQSLRAGHWVQGLRVQGCTCPWRGSIQLQFGHRWGELFGAKTGPALEVTLLPRERITQISGKHYTYIYQLIISTNHGRTFFFGQPYGYSFNAVPLSRSEYLAFITGHYSGSSLTGIAMHWADPRVRE
uniref:Jacalin-type lectin domain-containing protein n=1 Tax=Gopherus agassizii TaxID=38772 RepID=A0A452GLV5_9SAUR